MKKYMPLLFIFIILLFSSCTVSNKISRSASKEILNQAAFINAHTGISIYEPAKGKYWYNHNAEKYFTPASNTKLATCYAAMKYLGDSLVGLRYRMDNGAVDFIGTGDPSFLLPEFKNQPVFDFLNKSKTINYVLDRTAPGFTPLGEGWAWDDYLGDYSAERSEMPIYGNVVKFYLDADTVAVSPPFFYNYFIQWNNTILKKGADKYFEIVRPFEDNSFYTLHSSRMYHSKTEFTSQIVPFKTFSNSASHLHDQTFIKLLEDTLHKNIGEWSYVDAPPKIQDYTIIYSQPTDSLLKPMMHRSDNFFAEQSLLMVSEKLLGTMNDRKIIDSLLKTDYNLMPQKPGWVDGSGLSRYDLFSPKDFVFILNKMKNDFGMDRIKNILPTGGTGTISNYYLSDSGSIFVKTGTLN
ncbi:MAG: D-alanyl-D-alanine carboxypeptidase, partial [Ginsengibacter sp.]